MSPVTACTRLGLPFLLTLAACPGLAHADFLYGRLVPGPGIEPNGQSTDVDVSADGRTVVFASTASTWIGDEYTGTRVIAVDLDTELIEAISLDGIGFFRGESPAVSGDGRYVAFLTYSRSAYGPNWQALRKDRQTGAIEVASSNAAGQPASTGIEDNTLSISANGRYVAFQTVANMGAAVSPAYLPATPTGSSGEIYVKDMVSGAVEMASIKADGSASGGTCALQSHALSGDGRHLVMLCNDAMVPGATTGQLYLRNLQANTTELISRSAAAPNGTGAFSNRPAISPNARFITFQTPGYAGLGYADGTSSQGNSGVYLRDQQAGTLVSIARPGILPPANYDSCKLSAVSDIGSVVMHCYNNWLGADNFPQVFLYVPGAGTPQMISTDSVGAPGNAASGYTLAVNASGLSMAFASEASNLVSNDTNNASDIFVLVDESVISDTIFANGFDAAQLRAALAASAHIAAVGSASKRD